TLLCVPVYMIVVDPTKLGSNELPAPSAQVWAGVAQMLAKGVGALPRGAPEAMFVGAVIRVLLPLAQEYLPKKVQPFLPSATGLGIAGVIPAFNSVSMFIGAFLAWMLAKTHPKTDETYTIPVSSGLIAGESLMGVAVSLVVQGPRLWSQLTAYFGRF